VYLAGESLIEGVEKLVEEIEARNAITFDLYLPASIQLTDVVEEHLFRIVQEAFSNILRHAEASNVKLRMEIQANELFMHIADNGKGFVLHKRDGRKTSLGLQTMKERTEEIGGRFAIRPQVGEGTYIDIRLPID